MPPTIDIAGIETLSVAGNTVLVPQAHAARLLRAQLARAAGSSGNPPLAWHQWTASAWSGLITEGLDDRILLNRLQEEQLWAEVIAAHPAETLIHPDAVKDLARLARSAFQFAAENQCDNRLRATADTPDTRAFAQWLLAFQDRCRTQRLLPPAHLETALEAHVRAGATAHTGSLHLVGFEQISPAQDGLLRALAEAGTDVRLHALTYGAQEPQGRKALELAEATEELSSAARLAALHARELAQTNPGRPPRVAILCPEPAQLRNALERLFREHLAPELNDIRTDLSSTPWHFGSGAPLSSVPAITDALDLLRWCFLPLSLERVGQLLLSPFLFPATSLEERAAFSLASSRRVPALRGSLTLAELVATLPSAAAAAGKTAAFPELHALAHVLQRRHLLRGSLAPVGDWTEHVRTLLQTAGWPGARELSPAEFQATEAWESMLDLVATLQVSGLRLDVSALLGLLASEARNLPAPAAFVDAPIQVLTPAEAEGLTFDLTIVLNATEDRIPSIRRPHPFVSASLQRQFGIGDPAHALLQARTQLESLCGRSGAIYLLASRGGAEGDARLTTLAEELGFQENRLADLLPELPASAPVATEPVLDPHTLPLPAQAEVRGGVDVLRLQAACGFRAFATHRLIADDTPPRTMGIDPRESGSLLHAALELLWRQLGSQQALADLTPESRRTLARETVEEAFAQRRLRAPGSDSWAEHYLRVLKRRFVNLLTYWLEQELKRSPFTVLAQEEKQTLTLGPIRLSVRPDRVDAVAGGQVFVDYKTSYELSSSHWLDERPDAPQLPAYALSTSAETLRGIAFAQVRPGKKMGWISLSTTAGAFPKAGNRQLDLATQLELWRTELAGLAEQFAAGQARVNPKTYPHTCQYCAHRLLCRLDPADLLDQADTEDDAAEEDIFG